MTSLKKDTGSDGAEQSDDSFFPTLPSFCTKCAAKMVKGKERQWIDSFDSHTGKYTGAVEYTLRCEKLLSLKGRLGFAGYHDDFLVIEDPTRNLIGGKKIRTFLHRI